MFELKSDASLSIIGLLCGFSRAINRTALEPWHVSGASSWVDPLTKALRASAHMETQAGCVAVQRHHFAVHMASVSRCPSVLFSITDAGRLDEPS